MLALRAVYNLKPDALPRRRKHSDAGGAGTISQGAAVAVACVADGARRALQHGKLTPSNSRTQSSLEDFGLLHLWGAPPLLRRDWPT